MEGMLTSYVAGTEAMPAMLVSRFEIRPIFA